MRSVREYVLTPGVEATFDIPFNAKVLHVGDRVGEVVLWIQVDKRNTTEKRTFVALGSKASYDELTNLYLGTAVSLRGIVAHVFERKYN